MEEETKCPPAGAPAWVMTFADLMSLLMCFFVLLLSFATMDIAKFKKMAGGMAQAFGVQREVPTFDAPMGTSVIAEKFSAGTPDETLLDEVRQSTTKEEANLEIPEAMRQQIIAKAEAEAEKIRESLQDEVEAGLVRVETEGGRTIIRIQEKGSFGSGSAVPDSGFKYTMEKITASVRATRGKVAIAGHTDNIPISTEWYRSNWELASARAVTVAHELLQDGTIDQNRIVVEGYADTKPLAPNSSRANRAKNRRVEIVLIQDDGTGDEVDQTINY